MGESDSSTENTAVPNLSLEEHKALKDWVCSHGGYLNEGVRIAHDHQRGVHVEVRPDWHQGVSPETRVISAPYGVTMSYYNAVNYRSEKGLFSSHGVEFPREFIDAVGRAETMTFFLMAHFLRGDQSFWFPYLRTLPQPGELNTPLFFKEADVDWLEGTGIPDAAAQRYQDWDQSYESSVKTLEDTGFEGVEQFTWDLYLWAWTIIGSRAFLGKMLAGAVEPSDLPEEGISVLLPLIDLPNHRPLAKVEWKAGEQDVGLIVLGTVSAGQEISNNYGPRNNEQLLMNYGFCISDNPTDYRIVKLGVSSDSPLGQAKARQIQMFPHLANKEDDPYYIFNVSYPVDLSNGYMEHAIISPALFDALTVMEGNERERKSIKINESGISIERAYGNDRSVLAALSQICFELIAHILKLKDGARTLPSQPANLKQYFAKIYRDGQITLDKTALVIASWTLARARYHYHGPEVDEQRMNTLLMSHMQKIPTNCFTDEIMERVQSRILTSQSLVPQRGQLFRLGELFSLLPNDIQEQSQKYFMNRLANQPWGTDPQVMFALAINFLVATALSDEVKHLLTSRLTRWVGFLLANYPAPTALAENPQTRLEHLWRALSKDRDGFFAFASEDGVSWLHQDGPWLAPEWLQWACTVGDAERVLIPFDPLEVLQLDEQPNLLDQYLDQANVTKQAVLYVPYDEDEPNSH